MKKKILFAVPIALAVIFLIVNYLIGTAGEAVLLGTTCLNALIIMIGALFVWMLFSEIRRLGSRFSKQLLLFGLLGVLLLGFGTVREVDVVRDLSGGAVTRQILVTDLKKRNGLHGIWGLQYSVEGLLENGEKIVLPITGGMYSSIRPGQQLTAEYYPHSKKLVRFL